MELNLNIPDGNQPQNSSVAPQPSTSTSTRFLNEVPLHDIARVFTSFGSQSRVTVVPIGFPQAGKSMLLSSLFRYAVRGNDTTFNVNFENKFPFDNGRRSADTMVSYFENGKIYSATAKGTLDLVGVTINPTNNTLPSLDLAFLDLAGEDIQGIKTSIKGDFTAKINAVFNGLQVDDSPIIFLLITPFDPPSMGDSLNEAHQREDALHFDFLNYLMKDQPRLFSNSKFFIIASQWDKNTNPKTTVEEFIMRYRPSMYRAVMNSDVSWGHYSVGRLLTTQDESGTLFQELVRIDSDCPARVWKRLYTVCTNKSLDKKSFWEKLFS